MSGTSPAVARACRALDARPGARLLITGATGFVGSSVVALLDECAARGSRWNVVCASRGGPSNVQRAAHPNIAVEWIQRDVTQPFDDLGPFDLVLHAATSTDARIHADRPFEVVDSIVDGTRNLVRWAQRQATPPVVVHTSSGAVYGPLPVGAQAIPEDSPLAPEPFAAESGYAEAKRMAETMLAIATERGILEAVNLRLFAFVGPRQPHDGHFAITSFLRDAKAGGPIVVRGSGEVVRSYLYEEDMAAWIVAALAHGGVTPSLHVGSDQGHRLVDVATSVGQVTGVDVRVLGESSNDGRRGAYVPETTLARSVLDVEAWTSLDDAIRRTWSAWQDSSR